jgi:tRNA A-37 threonylcarbamoyl transferase component Bud32
VTFVAAVLALRLAVSTLTVALGRPRPPGFAILGDWQGYSQPSRPMATLAVTTVAAAFALLPAGRPRRWGFRAAAVLLSLLGLARVYLAVDHPSDALFAVVLGIAFAMVAFRLYCPDAIFPVSYRRRATAHLEIAGPRERAIREALEQQLGLKVSRVEPLEEEASGGSTPLRLHVDEREEDEEDLFGKLYSDTHLRSDRWYKLGRTIMYGALEDETAFNSVRQLVEYEDYMLRVMRDAGLPVPEPRGFAEIQPEREYLLVTDLLRDSEDADEADIDDDLIDQGLQVVRRLWDQGLAHRDLKPANVLIRDGRLFLIDVAFSQVRPSRWRQLVDLANMMLVLTLTTDAERVYRRALKLFDPGDVADGFAATRRVTMPSQLRTSLKEDGRDLVAEFRRLGPTRERIAIQRWSIRRIWLTVRTAAQVAVVAALLVVNLASLGAP